MAYNKAAEEKKWLRWKESEEKELRRLDVSEDVIQRLRKADWDDFKAERRFYEHSYDMDTYLDRQAADEPTPDIQTVQDLLDNIDNEDLHKFLTNENALTLQIVLWKMEGSTSDEIAMKCHLSVNAIDLRIWHLKGNIIKYL